MTIPRVIAAGGLVAFFSVSAGLAQSLHEPSSAVAVHGSVIFPADGATKTSGGGSFELEHRFSNSISLGAIAGFWSGDSGFAQDSEESYLAAIATYHWGVGRVRPFFQLGGGIYWLQLQFQSRNRFAPNEKEIRGGVFAGPGLDFALSRSCALEVRVRYHLVGDASSVHPDFLESQLGLRFFF